MLRLPSFDHFVQIVVRAFLFRLSRLGLVNNLLVVRDPDPVSDDRHSTGRCLSSDGEPVPAFGR